MNPIVLEKLEWLIGIYWDKDEIANFDALGIDCNNFEGTRDLLRSLSSKKDNATLIRIANALLTNTQLQNDYERKWNYNYVYVYKQVDSLLQTLRDEGCVVDGFHVRPSVNKKALLQKDGTFSIPLEVFPRFKARTFTIDEKLAFVLMPLREPFFSILDKHIRPVCAKFNLTTINAGDVDRIDDIMENIWTSINTARVIIADLSGKNPNVFYELGIAHTIGRKVIMITHDDKEPFPFDIGGIKGIRYTFPSEMAAFEAKLENILCNLLKETDSNNH